MNSKRIFLALMVTVLAFLSLATTAQYSASGAGARSKRLEGAWVVNIMQQGFPPARRLFTFISDGGLVTADVLQPTPQGVELFGVGHGAWLRTGHREFAATFVGLRSNLQGMFLGTYKVQMSLSE